MFLLAFPLFFLPSCQEDSLCTELTWYRDADGDGLGDPADTVTSCERPSGYVAEADPNGPGTVDPYAAVRMVFGGRIDPNQPFDYAGQTSPNYVRRDNTDGNDIQNEVATLGRVLFYDTQLSFNNTISCASCHQQSAAFGDRDALSTGVAGLTGRHSMRLVNARFGDEPRFFWDERANTLEAQTTMPIQDHIEMGFSGTMGDPGITELFARLADLDYYQELFEYAYGDTEVTEERLQNALAQFIRSIQSFDAKYDEGRAMVNDNNDDFPNFTAAENRGKQLFTDNPRLDRGQRIGGGFGCQGCHQAPEFSIRANSGNNGIIGVANDPSASDLTVTRSPSLRDLLDQNGVLNGPLMHDASITTLDALLDHYNAIDPNEGLDPRLRPQGRPLRLNITPEERQDFIAFLRTLSGSAVYSDEQWSDPF